LVGFLLGGLTAPNLAPDADPFSYSLFVAIALAITAVPILGRILREYGLTRAPVGVIAISAAALNDVVGWVLLAGVTAYASSSFSAVAAAIQIAGVAGMAAILFFLGPKAVDRLLKRFPIEDGTVPGPLMAIVLATIFIAGVMTQRLGVFTIFGGFLAGLSFHKHEAFVAAWMRQVGQFVLVFFLPIFFTYTGLRTNLLGLDTPQDWIWCAVIFASAVVAKIVPVYIAARAAGFPAGQSSVLGALMNTRALMELIVLNIGLSFGILPQDVFTMLVLMAVGTTIMAGPLLRHLMPKAGLPISHRSDA
ncbi:MAG: cation:proton antiporter, partial [Pseudomonadota bacterium]